MKFLAIVLSLLLVSGCASTGHLSNGSGGSPPTSSQSNGAHWTWWLLGMLALSYAISHYEVSGDDSCDRYPYTREDGITVLGNINCIGF